MSAETERSAGGSVDSRRDLGGGEWYASSSSRTPGAPPASIGDPASLCPPTPQQSDGHEYGQNDPQKTSDLSTGSSSFDGEAVKNSLHRTNSDTSYSSMETDFLMPTTRHVSGSSAKNLELNVVDFGGSFISDLSQQLARCSPPPEASASLEDAPLVSNSEEIIAETGSVGPTVAAVPSEQEAICLIDGALEQYPEAALHLPDQDFDGPLKSTNRNSKNLDKVYLTKQRADSLESLAFKSMEPIADQDTDLFHSLNGRNSKLSGFSKSWSTPSAFSLLDKTSKVDSRSSDHQSDLNDSVKTPESCSCPPSGSSAESSQAVALASDGVERAREILAHSSDIYLSTPAKEQSPKTGLRNQDGTKALGDIGLNGTSAKLGKSSSEKKKRGLSWYSRQKKLVLSPTYKFRSDDFKRIFKDIPSSERLIVDYSCALQKDILVQGRLYISQSWVCFYANIFRWETILTIRCKDIVKLTKERTARVIPNAIQILTKDEKFFFTSFGTRDKTFLMLERVWRNGINDETMSRQELWQWVHYGYGEDLGLTSGDEDYIPLTAEDKIKFQTRVQKEESKLQKLSQRGDTSAAADSNKECSGDFLAVNGEFQPSIDDIDSSVADNLSVTSADDSIYAFSESQNLTENIMHSIPCTATTPACPDGVVPGTMSSGAEQEDEDSTGDEDVVRCSGHDHFGIDVFDEVLNIPVDSVFEHCFTDSPLYREFAKNKKTFDVVLSPWPEEADVNGVKIRNIAYTLSLGYSIGPKYSPSTERQIMHPESRPGLFYLIDTECINGGIPYGENFYIVNRFCISKVSSNKSHLRITSELRYRKSVWGFVKSFIDKNATAGLLESFSVMADLLRQESDRQMALVTCQKSAVGRRKFLRRRRPVDHSPAKLPATDGHNQNLSKQSTPVKHSTPKASTAKVKEDWHVRLTVDILVRIVCFVLILLMVFNAVLFYKLWSLEVTATNVLLTQKPVHFSFSDRNKDNRRPESDEDWTSLLKKQRVLHDSEMKHWKEILSTSIQLMDEMIRALTDLRSSIDKRSSSVEDDRGGGESEGA